MHTWTYALYTQAHMCIYICIYAYMHAYYMIYPWKGSRCCYRIITEEDALQIESSNMTSLSG